MCFINCAINCAAFQFIPGRCRRWWRALQIFFLKIDSTRSYRTRFSSLCRQKWRMDILHEIEVVYIVIFSYSIHFGRSFTFCSFSEIIFQISIIVAGWIHRKEVADADAWWWWWWHECNRIYDNLSLRAPSAVRMRFCAVDICLQHQRQPHEDTKTNKRRRTEFSCYFDEEIVFLIFHVQSRSQTVHARSSSTSHMHFHYINNNKKRIIEAEKNKIKKNRNKMRKEIFETKFLSILHGKFVSSGKRISRGYDEIAKELKFYFDRVWLLLLRFAIRRPCFLFSFFRILHLRYLVSLTQEIRCVKTYICIHVLLCAVAVRIYYLFMWSRNYARCAPMFCCEVQHERTSPAKCKGISNAKITGAKLKTVHASRL